MEQTASQPKEDKKLLANNSADLTWLQQRNSWARAETTGSPWVLNSEQDTVETGTLTDKDRETEIGPRMEPGEALQIRGVERIQKPLTG